MAAPSWSLTSLYHTVIDASDLDRSVAFYRTLGFEVLDDRRDVKWPDFLAKNFGVRRAQGRGVLMVLPEDPEGPMLDIIQWVEPPPPGPDPRVPADLRIPRILAFRMRDIRRAYDDLRARGVEFTNELLGPFSELGVRGVACCKDPDGTIIELIELEPGVRHSQAKSLGEDGSVPG
jgi:catechol 2,3-dioxygenase-like lactoylglutathione lyase family enzyme